MSLISSILDFCILSSLFFDIKINLNKFIYIKLNLNY
jgi:hypothetical protein